MKDVIIVDKATRKGIKKEVERFTGRPVDVFKLPKQRKGETDSQYFYHVYQLNKGFFGRELEGRASQSAKNYKAFLMEAEARKVNFRMGAREAALNAVKSRWMSGEEVARQNIIEGLKSHGLFGRFRNMTRDERGRFTKFDLSKLSFDSETGMYAYGDVRMGWHYSKGEGVRFEMTRNGVGMSMEFEDEHE